MNVGCVAEPRASPSQSLSSSQDSLICQDNEKKAGDDLVGVREAEESS